MQIYLRTHRLTIIQLRSKGRTLVMKLRTLLFRTFKQKPYRDPENWALLDPKRTIIIAYKALQFP